VPEYARFRGIGGCIITPWYIAVEPFDPRAGENWTNYVARSGLTQLVEVVSLDSSLCPCVIKELQEEGWKHNVHKDYVIDFFLDLDYLLKRVVDLGSANILAAVRNPVEECTNLFPDGRFEFRGYDLIGSGMSALTNCGGYPLAFRDEELSTSGLLGTLVRARAVQTLLRKHYPDGDHSDCDIWALWKMRAEREE
jgi:hypothetical protein